MDHSLITRRWAIVVMALSVVLFFTPQIEAQDAKPKPKKSRGDIMAIDLEKKSITLKNKKGEKTHTWNDGFKLRIDGEKGNLSDVKVGMFALCWLDESNKIASMRVTSAAKEEGAEEKTE